MGNQIILAEIDLPIASQGWVNVEPGIFRTRVTPGDQVISDAYGESGYYQGRNTLIYNVQSLSINFTQYTRTDNLEDLYTYDSIFYYNKGTTDLYIVFVGRKTPEVFQSKMIGTAIGYVDKASEETDSYYSDVYYDARLKSVPSLKKKKDPLDHGIMAYQGGIVQLSNVDGALDQFANQGLYGQPVRFRKLQDGKSYDESEIVHTGFIESSKNDFKTLNIKIRDKRAALKQSLPASRFTTTDFPNIEDRYIDKPIPIAFGTIKKAPVIKIDTTTFFFCDPTYVAPDAAITAYVDGIETATTGDPTTGKFSISGYTSGKVTVDFVVSACQNSLDIIKHLLVNYANTHYITANFYTDEWEYERSRAKDIGIYIGKSTTIEKVIQDIVRTERGTFDVLGDGRYSFRHDDPDRPVRATIRKDELQLVSIEDSEKEYASSVEIFYSYEEDEKEYLSIYDNRYEYDVLSTYKIPNHVEFKTNFVSKTDAEEFATAVVNALKTRPNKVRIKTRLDYTWLRIGDLIAAEIDRPIREIFGMAQFEVLEIDPNLLTGELSLLLAYKEPYSLPNVTTIDSFLGEQLCGEAIVGEFLKEAA